MNRAIGFRTPKPYSWIGVDQAIDLSLLALSLSLVAASRQSAAVLSSWS